MRKVFCIGFHKTGTSSIGLALEALGYRVTGPNFVNDPRIHRELWALARPLIDKYDGFQDNPWPILYRQIERAVPDAKFILTYRDPEDWLRSVRSFFGSHSTPMREIVYGYGSPEGNVDIYLDRYHTHYAEVCRHFSDQPERLLRINLFEGDGWPKICSFLDKQTPDVKFPHVRPIPGE